VLIRPDYSDGWVDGVLAAWPLAEAQLGLLRVVLSDGKEWRSKVLGDELFAAPITVLNRRLCNRDPILVLAGARGRLAEYECWQDMGSFTDCDSPTGEDCQQQECDEENPGACPYEECVFIPAAGRDSSDEAVRPLRVVQRGD
jgi:hypothetical protein